MKLLILVLSHNEEPYISLENTIRETWGNHSFDNIKILYYYGNGDNKLLDDKIYLDSPEGIPNIGYKTIKAYEFLYENFEFDYVFRTNSSSYVNIKNLIEYLKDKPLNNFYNGHVGNHNGISYASGCGYTLSRDLIEKIITNKESWNHDYIDDVALGGLLNSLNIIPTSAPRVDINSTDNDYFFINGQLINVDTIKNSFHFRCKTTIEKDRSKDIEIIKNLNKILK